MDKQCSFLAFANFNRKTLRCEKFLNEMNNVIPWNKLVNLIKPYYTHHEVGRKRKHLTMMLKIYFLQNFYNLSDPEMEDAIYDRNSFQKFLEIDMMKETAPDETTILNFRHLLEKHNLPTRMFNKVNRLLEEKGLILKKGTIVDATIINAPSSTKNNDGIRDTEMKSTKKGNNWYFGMKLHIGVDKDSGLVHTVKATAANIHDSQLMDELRHGQEREIYGDKGYDSVEKAVEYKNSGINWQVLKKAAPGHKLSKYFEKKNKRLSSIRSKVEKPFQILKCQWNFRKTRYKNIYKNEMKAITCFMLGNLFMVRKRVQNI